MTSQEYIKQAIRTESRNEYYNEKLNVSTRIDHGIMGIVTEGGEMLDAIKRAKFYGKELDIVNVKEEMGDIFWYLAIMCDELQVSFEDLWEKNIAKLKARYPEKYNHTDAINRDLDNERKVLESKNVKK